MFPFHVSFAPGQSTDLGCRKSGFRRFGWKVPKPGKTHKGASVTTSRSPGRADPSFLAIKPLGTLPAAGHVLAKIPFYTGFTKREGGPCQNATFGKNHDFHDFSHVTTVT